MHYSAEDEAKISAVMKETECSRDEAIKYLDDADWHVHGALCDYGQDQCAASYNKLDDEEIEQEF